jgi:hypothetical protein
MMAGAVLGGLMLRNASVAAPLWTAAGQLAVWSVAAHSLSRAASAEGRA